MEGFLDILYQWLIKSGAKVIAILVVSYVLIRLVRVFVNKSRKKISDPEVYGIERVKRADTLAGLIYTTARVAISAAALLMALQAVGINIGPLLAGAGIIGLAVGFGAQSLVKDVISGFFILLENHINVGDVVSIGGVAGVVESINLRVTSLRDLAGSVHVVPNGEISVITNMTKEYSRAVIDVGVAYKEDVDEVIRVLKEVGSDLENDAEYASRILEPLEVLGLDSFGDSSVNIKVRMKTKPIEQWGVAREFRRRLKKAFDREGIEIPFPHVTLYLGEGENRGVLRVETSALPR